MCIYVYMYRSGGGAPAMKDASAREQGSVLYLLIADVTVYNHSDHPTWGCIPRHTLRRKLSTR